MAERRMFSKKITDGDVFTSMPPTTQCLYFHLCMSADDDGFSNNIRVSMFNAHASTDDFNTLVMKKFIIPFESGVIVIKHWKMHNYVRCDRYNETKYLEEKSRLVLKDNGVYTMDTNGMSSGMTSGIPMVATGKDSIGKDSIGKISIEIEKGKESIDKYKKHSVFVPPSVEMVKEYCDERCNDIDAEEFVDFYTSKGWMVGKNKMKDWKAAIRTWERSKKKNSSKGNRSGERDLLAELREV